MGHWLYSFMRDKLIANSAVAKRVLLAGAGPELPCAIIGAYRALGHHNSAFWAISNPRQYACMACNLALMEGTVSDRQFTAPSVPVL